MREEKKYEVLPGVEIPDIKKIQEAASDFSVSDVGEVEIRTINLQPVVQSAAPGVSDADLSQLQSLGNKVAEDEARSQAESRAKMEKIMHNVKAPESINDLKKSHIAQVDAEKRKELEESIKADEQQKAEEDAKSKAREERRQLQQRLLEESRERAAKLKAEKERLDKALAVKAERDRAAQEKREVEEKAKATAEAAASGSSEQEGTPDKKADTPAEVKKPAATEARGAAPESQAAATETKPENAEQQKAAAEPKPVEKPVEPEVKKTATVVSNAEAFDDFKEFLEDDDQ